jgi:hypothetical protein
VQSLKGAIACIDFPNARDKLQPMLDSENRLRRVTRVIGTLAMVILLLGAGGAGAQELKTKVSRLSGQWAFNFVSWELSALASKLAYGLLSPQRLMTDEQQSRFVLSYLADINEARRLSAEIERIYADPDVVDPEQDSQDTQTALADVRQRIATRGPIAEAILQSQVSQVFSEAGLGYAGGVLPPVSGTFTPLPHILVVSPRSVIQSADQEQLIAGLNAADQEAIEELVMGALPDYSAYVTAIGGLAAYPAMLLESGSIEWVADVMAHEWVHHYLAFHPLGWYYMRSGETRTINETTASLMGDWAGQEVVLRFYDPLRSREKGLPNALTIDETAQAEEGDRFDFRAEMHITRVTADELLAEGKIEEAEAYMEARRRVFVENGYRIRRLNQAYFAFHGAYASTPGASGADPIGPLVRQAWAVSGSPADFLQVLAPITSLEGLRGVLTG